jgi:hypothetical protein
MANANAKKEAHDEPGIVDLVQDAVKDAQELVRIEIALAKNELKTDATKLQSAAIAFVVAYTCAVLMLAMLLVAVVIAVGGAAPALILAAALFGTACSAGVIGYKLIPREAPLDDTKEHAEAQAHILKEKIA